LETWKKEGKNTGQLETDTRGFSARFEEKKGDGSYNSRMGMGDNAGTSQ